VLESLAARFEYLIIQDYEIHRIPWNSIIPKIPDFRHPRISPKFNTSEIRRFRGSSNSPNLMIMKSGDFITPRIRRFLIIEFPEFDHPKIPDFRYLGNPKISRYSNSPNLMIMKSGDFITPRIRDSWYPRRGYVIRGTSSAYYRRNSHVRFLQETKSRRGSPTPVRCSIPLPERYRFTERGSVGRFGEPS